MRILAVVACLLLVSLAGCAEKKGGDDEPEATGTGTASGSRSGTRTGTTSSFSGTGTGGPANNTAPDANVTADVDNGTAPLVVNFTLAGNDTDGDAITWTFDADGDGTPEANGTTLPATVQHVFNETGEFRAALNVTDGNASVTAIRLIVVTEGGASGGLVERDDYFFEPATGMCHAKEYEELGPGLYAWGDWTIMEDNDVDGVQLENNHPAKDVPPGFFNLALDDPCADGDQIVA